MHRFGVNGQIMRSISFHSSIQLIFVFCLSNSLICECEKQRTIDDDRWLVAYACMCVCVCICVGDFVILIFGINEESTHNFNVKKQQYCKRKAEWAFHSFVIGFVFEVRRCARFCLFNAPILKPQTISYNFFFVSISWRTYIFVFANCIFWAWLRCDREVCVSTLISTEKWNGREKRKINWFLLVFGCLQYIWVNHVCLSS